MTTVIQKMKSASSEENGTSLLERQKNGKNQWNERKYQKHSLKLLGVVRIKSFTFYLKRMFPTVSLMSKEHEVNRDIW